MRLMYFLFIVSVSIFSNLQSQPSQGKLADNVASFLLEDFDGNGVWDIHYPNDPRKVDADGSGDLEGLFVGEAFQTIMVFRIKRNDAELRDAFKSFKSLVFEVAAIPKFNRGQYLQNMIMLQTDVTGSAVYEIIEDLKFTINRDGLAQTNRMDLFEKKSTQSISNVEEAFQQYLGGDGKFFNIALIQATSKGDKSLCVYDNIRLE